MRSPMPPREGLPLTLVHGDAKVANFARGAERPWAFDWAFAGRAPATLARGLVSLRILFRHLVTEGELQREEPQHGESLHFWYVPTARRQRPLRRRAFNTA